uniref:CBFA2/RUNX1 partner transcriptional co-repressor 2 n=1 Tax=Latimeria chalumnae TaxID=7897 RepID=H3AMJ6_LATCH
LIYIVCFCADTGERRTPTMPGSPLEVKIHSRSTPPTIPPLPPVNAGGPKPALFTPIALTNGISHSPPALSGAQSPPHRFSNGPAASSSSFLANQQLPATCGARQLSKLKRFLTTLQQFGNDISLEIGEKVRTLVLALVKSLVTIEEFHSKLQEATNFPLRPFVIPFLKANLPLLQRELLHCARAAKQTPSQYLAQHEHTLLSSNVVPYEDSSELLMEEKENGKRSSPDRKTKNQCDNNFIPNLNESHSVCTHSLSLRITCLSENPEGRSLYQYFCCEHTVKHIFVFPINLLKKASLRILFLGTGLNGGYRGELVNLRLTEREWADEWKHLDHVLNCIMDMVEKTRRSMAVLRRCQEADREELIYWKRRYSDGEDGRKVNGSLSRQHSPGSTDSLNEDCQRDFSNRSETNYVTDEIRRKAEEAVNEVKRQAMSEVQKAVAEAEQKAFDMIASERARMEQTIADAKRQATEDAFSMINEQEESTESCWNCGRKASETCSGCNFARYCGSFCQYKDWEKHHRICGEGTPSQGRSTLVPAKAAGKLTSEAASPAFEKASAASSSCSSTPVSSLTSTD